MNWDDLRFVLAVDREGGLAAAARALAINYSTAHRRLDQIERKIGVRLFRRLRTGYRLTKQGATVSDAARRMEAEALAVERQVVGADQKLSGEIRVSTSELLGLYLLPDMIGQFMDQYPEVRVELAISDELANLQRSDADVVVRGSANPPPSLVGRKVAPVPYCAYAHRRLVRGNSGRPLADYPWIFLRNQDPHAPLTRWTREIAPEASCRLRIDSGAGVCELLARGLGAAVVPCFVGDPLAELVRISEVRTDSGINLWVLSHVDLRRTARVVAFRRFMEARLAASPHLWTS